MLRMECFFYSCYITPHVCWPNIYTYYVCYW